MNRKISVNLALAIAIIAMTVTFSVTVIMSQNMFDKTVSSVREKELEYKKLAEIDKTVRAECYYPIDNNVLFDMLGAGFMAGISDQNAKYYTAKQYLEYLNEQAGKSIGIGTDFVKEVGSYPRVIRVYGSSPAADLGIANGFTLRQIDGTDLKNLTVAQIDVLLRGEDGTTLNLLYADQSGNALPAVEVQRRQYETPSIETRMNENEVIGYIKILTFNGQTAGELQRALDTMRAAPQGFQGLILDVRNNTGGTLKYALDALDMICPAGPMGYQQGKEGEPVVLGISDEAQKLSVPMAVLVNAGTASGAELFAGAVREFGLGQLVGINTAGKGSVQCVPIRLSDGSAISYTVGTLLTGKGTPFDGAGFAPDVE
ncbi:MAG: S41 family peptidase, partial [Ruthenibacterium sp.]